MHKLRAIICLALISLCGIASAQQGALDNSFIPQVAAGAFVKALAIQSDGKIIIGGNFPGSIARLNATGSADNSFVTGIGTNSSVAAIALQSDGKVVIGGIFTSYNGTSANRIVRLNANGSIDNSFNTGAGLSGMNRSFNSPPGVTAMAIQPDGKIIVAGCFDFYNGTPVENIIRLNTNGSLDNTFSATASPNDNIVSAALQSDGKIIAGGRFYLPLPYGTELLARVDAGGAVDNMFAGNNDLGPVNVAQVYAIALQSDGKIIIGGSINYCNGTTGVKRICRLNADGTMDNSFLINQISPGLYYEVRALAVQNNGKILVGGKATLLFNDTLNRLVRLNSNGTVDNTFITGAGVNCGDVYALGLQTNGKIILAGDFKAYDGTARNGVARLTADNATGLTANNFHLKEGCIFPNPNNGIFTLQLNGEEAAEITVTNVLGKTVYHARHNTPSSSHEVDLSNYAKGIYSVFVNCGNGQYKYKAIVK